jgi:replicative DNA helicase
VHLPDYGVYVPIRDLVGKSGFRVTALNSETWRLEPRIVTNAFSTGRKPVYRLQTRLGRTIRATGNHKFLSFSGWRRLDDLGPGARIALPRRTEGHGEATMTEAEVALLGHLIGDGCTLPRHVIQYTSKDRDLAELVASLATEVFGEEVRPRIRRERTWYQVYLPATKHTTHRTRNPVAKWLDELGAYGFRSWEKRVPDRIFAQPNELIATFLRHLWATDGCLRADPKSGVATVRYDSSNEVLVRDVRSLLLRLGINGRTRPVDQGSKGRLGHRLDIWNREDAERFLLVVSAVGGKQRQKWELVELFERRRPAMQRSGMTTRAMQSAIGTHYCGSTLYKSGLSRERALRVADAVDSDELGLLALSDVYWDEIASVEPDGVEDVYDLTVEGLHNFVADDIVVHNSIEQDSDLVIFVYRDEYYNEESDQQGLAELILSKHRNGPTGIEKLSFLKRYAKFADLAA